MKTHIETLGDNTPKSRRRVRRTLKLPVGATVGHHQSCLARETAELRERAYLRKAVQS